MILASWGSTRSLTPILFVIVLVGSYSRAEDWKRLPSIPDKEGFAGSFTGVSNGALLVAGGANFPDKKPWEGGKKVWTDAVFVLEKPDGEWKRAGKLPRPLGYGVCVSHGNGVVCVGGSDAERHYADAFRLEWKGGKPNTTQLPSLPRPLANAAGALVGQTLYLAGGQEAPDSRTASNRCYRLDLGAAEPAWKEIDAIPGGGRILPVAASFDGSFWIVGGAELVEKGGKAARRYLKDGYRLDPKLGWKGIADLPHAIVAAPSPAPAGTDGFLILGGDDGSQVELTPDRHRGFRQEILRFDARSKSWVAGGKLPAPRVTVPCVEWRGKWVIPGGEVRPGVRSPEVWSLPVENKE